MAVCIQRNTRMYSTLTLVSFFIIEEFSGCSFKFSKFFVFSLTVNPIFFPWICKFDWKKEVEINKKPVFVVYNTMEHSPPQKKIWRDYYNTKSIFYLTNSDLPSRNFSSKKTSPHTVASTAATNSRNSLFILDFCKEKLGLRSDLSPGLLMHWRYIRTEWEARQFVFIKNT